MNAPDEVEAMVHDFVSIITYGQVSALDRARAIREARALGISPLRRVPSETLGFVYLTVLVRPRTSACFYAGGAMGHPATRRRYFGSAKAAGWRAALADGAVRLIVGATSRDKHDLNALERRLLTRLNAAASARFWNQHNAAGAGWGSEVARAAWADPSFAAGRFERARKAVQTRRRRAADEEQATKVSL